MPDRTRTLVRTEERGDELFTLESLVGVIDEANRTGQLVVFRHL